MTVAARTNITLSQKGAALIKDLKRDLWCVMGLPFDATTEQDTYNHLLECIEKRQRCFLTTPNLNFVVAAQKDASFRQTVIDSDWVIADGMPIIWAAKALGIPLKERVAGSSVFDRLRNEYRQHDRPLRVVFFGGPDGVAAEAFKKIAQDDSAMEVVGFYSPGFGTIEEMSPQYVIDQINESEPDIVLVALGAKRGQQWIEYNRQRLSVPVISHLGAVVNFVAGTVARAPEWMQKTGLEWLWRIWEEHKLLTRYWTDGRKFLISYFKNILPSQIILKRAYSSEHPPSEFRFRSDSESLLITIKGRIGAQEFRTQLIELASYMVSCKNLQIDFSDVTYFDNGVIASLMMTQKHLKSDGLMFLAGLSKEQIALIKHSGASSLLYWQ